MLACTEVFGLNMCCTLKEIDRSVRYMQEDQTSIYVTGAENFKKERSVSFMNMKQLQITKLYVVTDKARK